MTPSTPTLREAAKAVLEISSRKFDECSNGPECENEDHKPTWDAFKAALASESEVPDAPTVDRWEVDTAEAPWAKEDHRRTFYETDGWKFYAERPIPAKSRREEVAEALAEVDSTWEKVRTATSNYEEAARRYRLLREKP